MPFGEYVSFRSLLEGLSPRFDEVPRDMLPGKAGGPLTVDTAKGPILVANAICFDIAVSDAVSDQVRAGAQLLTVQTSNVAFTGSSQPEQQFTISSARALETGRAPTRRRSQMRRRSAAAPLDQHFPLTEGDAHCPDRDGGEQRLAGAASRIAGVGVSCSGTLGTKNLASRTTAADQDGRVGQHRAADPVERRDHNRDPPWTAAASAPDLEHRLRTIEEHPARRLATTSILWIADIVQ